MKTIGLYFFLLPAVLLVTSCAKKKTANANAGHDHSAHRHEHKAPHDGTPVVLGAETFHLELVLDSSTGKLRAYVLDGEMENYIRLKSPSFEVIATVAGAKQTLAFNAVGNSATGEKVGDSALFEATAEWLKTTPSFDAVLTKIEIRGTAFTEVAFNFPKGNEKG